MLVMMNAVEMVVCGPMVVTQIYPVLFSMAVVILGDATISGRIKNIPIQNFALLKFKSLTALRMEVSSKLTNSAMVKLFGQVM